MQTVPQNIVLDGGPDTPFPISHLRCGVWLIEDGSQPPAGHDPELLLDGIEGRGRLAISLRTSSLLTIDLASVLAKFLAAAECPMTPLGVLALHEITHNAVLHGNLEIASGESAHWSDLVARDALLAEAIKDATRAARVVTIAMIWGPGRRAWAVVADEGPGYGGADSVQESPRSRRGAGRGLILARAGAEVEVLHGGRCTRLAFRDFGAEWAMR